jgi:hypothetical protein
VRFILRSHLHSRMDCDSHARLVCHACTVASDPLKLAQFREVLRLRRACVAARDCSSSDAAFRNFNRLLTKVGEHTWGVDVKVAVFPRTTVFSSRVCVIHMKRACSYTCCRHS